MKTLMHICCAPCANRPIAALREEGIELAGFWYNPNIHPYTEYRSRKTCRKAHHQKDRSKARHQAGISHYRFWQGILWSRSATGRFPISFQRLP